MRRVETYACPPPDSDAGDDDVVDVACSVFAANEPIVILPASDLAALDRVVAAARYLLTCGCNVHRNELQMALAALDGKDGGA